MASLKDIEVLSVSCPVCAKPIKVMVEVGTSGSGYQSGKTVSVNVKLTGLYVEHDCRPQTADAAPST